MFNNKEEDFKKIFEVIDVQGGKKRIWKNIEKELNDFFGVKLTGRQWKNQYENAQKRTKKFNSPLMVSKPALFDIPEPTPLVTLNFDELKNKLKSYIFKSKSLDEISKYLKVDSIQALGLLESLKMDGYLIVYEDYTKTYIMDKKPAVEFQKYDHSIGEVRDIEFLVISDSHWCSIKQQKQFVEHIYDEAERRGVTNVYHVGDIVDGYYKNRPEQIFELIPGLIGADQQAEYVIANWPKRKGITTHLIIGNHDETHIKNGGFNIGKAIAKDRDDFRYLGIGYARIQLSQNCSMDMFHPLDGSSYAVSYSGQKYMDSLTGGDKPNILFTGHHHKVLYFPYRNIHYFEVPSMMAQSSWMKRKRIANTSGAWFIKLSVDEEGSIISLIPEYIHQYKYLENDF